MPSLHFLPSWRVLIYWTLTVEAAWSTHGIQRECGHCPLGLLLSGSRHVIIAMWSDKLFNRGVRTKRKEFSPVFLIVFVRILFCSDYFSIIRVMIFMVLSYCNMKIAPYSPALCDQWHSIWEKRPQRCIFMWWVKSACRSSFLSETFNGTFLGP